MRKIAVIAGAVMAVFYMAIPASAEVTPPCTASIEGKNVASLSSTKPSDAIEVQWDAVVHGAGSAPGGKSYNVFLGFAGFEWEVGKGKVKSDETWDTSVAVKDYGTYGTGLYKVRGQTNGSTVCSGAALVRLVGKNPFTTLAGMFAAAIAGIGAIGAATSAVRSGRRKKTLAVDGASLAEMMAAVSTPGQWVSCVLRAVEVKPIREIFTECGLRAPARQVVETNVCRWRIK